MHKSLLATALSLFALAASAAVDVNQASQAELETIQGIGPALSAKILDERSKALFSDWSDLTGRVKGLGPSQAAKLSAAGMTVNGLAFKARGSETRHDNKTEKLKP